VWGEVFVVFVLRADACVTSDEKYKPDRDQRMKVLAINRAENLRRNKNDSLRYAYLRSGQQQLVRLVLKRLFLNLLLPALCS